MWNAISVWIPGIAPDLPQAFYKRIVYTLSGWRKIVTESMRSVVDNVKRTGEGDMGSATWVVMPQCNAVMPTSQNLQAKFLMNFQWGNLWADVKTVSENVLSKFPEFQSSMVFNSTTVQYHICTFQCCTSVLLCKWHGKDHICGRWPTIAQI